MSVKYLSVSVALFSAITACGCISESIQAANTQHIAGTPADEKVVEKVNEPQISKNWQDKFLEIFRKDYPKANVAYGLFSYSGWANDGQVMVFGEEGKGGVALASKPASKNVDSTRELSAAEFAAIEKELKGFRELDDLETGVMDGLQFEFVKATKDSSGEIKVSQRTYMNNPGVGKPAPQHTALVKAFAPFKAK